MSGILRAGRIKTGVLLLLVLGVLILRLGSEPSIALADVTPPVTTLSTDPSGPDGENGWFTSAPLATLSSSEPGLTFYRWVSSDAWSTYFTPLIAPEGIGTLEYYSTDDAENTETVQATILSVDLTRPTDPTSVTSPSHTTGDASDDNTIDINWSGAADSVSGVDGFSYSFTNGAADVPDANKDAEQTASSATSAVLADGSWYFHLRTKDNAGNWTSTVHLGPFTVDTAPPPPPPPPPEPEEEHTVLVWPRWSEAPYGYWSKLAGTVKDPDGDPVALSDVYLQYKDGQTWKWLKTVVTNSNGYYQHWFYYGDGARTYRSRHAESGVYSNLTTPTFTNNITTWNNYRPKVRYCQWTKMHGMYGGPNGVYKNHTLYLQRWNGSSWVWQATVNTNAAGYYAAWAPVCPTTTFRMATAGSAVTSAQVTKIGTTLIGWKNTWVHASIKDGYGTLLSGWSLYLQKWNGSQWAWQATCKTTQTGYCNFGSTVPSGSLRVATGGSKVVSKTF